MAGVLQHLRSSTLDKRPNPASMVDGQVAINYASGSPGMFFKDSNGSLVKVGPVHVGSGAPNAVPASGGTAGNSLGEQWLDTSGGTYVFRIWDGAAWRSEAGEFVNTTGDTMTGALGIITGSASTPGLFFSGDANSGIYSPGADQVAISTNGTGRLFVTSDGKIGVAGTPSNPLDVFGSATLGIRYKSSGSYAGIVADNTSSTGGGYFGCHQNGTQKAVFGLTGAFLGDTSADAGVFAETGQAIRFFTNGSTSEKARITDDGKLGLGTSSPVSRLHVAQSLAGNDVSTGAALLMTTSTATNDRLNLNFSLTGNGDRARAGIGAVALDGSGGFNCGLAFYTRNQADGSTLAITDERMRIDSSGRVGIGTTTPQAKLHINNGTNENVRFATGGSGDQRIQALNDAGDTSVQLSLQASPLLFRGAGGTEIGRWDTSGRFLVGTSSSTGAYYDGASDWQGRFQVARSDQNAVASFSIWNSTASTYTNYGGVQLHLSACRSGTVGSHTSGALSSGDTIGSITFDASDGTNFRNSARIEAVVDGGVSTGDVPGRLVFSVSQDGSASPTERLRINNIGTHFFFSGGTDTLIVRNANAANTSNEFINCLSDGTGITSGGSTSFRVYTNGNVQNANNSYSGISDAKLKENIVDAGSQWDDLKAFQVRKFNFKEGQTHTQIGLVAQEVELVSPGLVTESPDRDAEGNDLGTVTKSVNYSVLYMKAVKALQEAMERIETLEAKVAALEAV